MSYGSWVLMVTQNEKDIKTDTVSWYLGVESTFIVLTSSKTGAIHKYQNCDIDIKIPASNIKIVMMKVLDCCGRITKGNDQ